MEYYSNLTLNSTNKTKAVWSIINENKPKNKLKNNTISLITNDVEVSDAKTVANIFLESFSKINFVKQDSTAAPDVR